MQDTVEPEKRLTKIIQQDKEPILIGNDLGQIETVRWMLRSPFDTNVVVQYGYQEVVFDYALANMGLADETHLSMPVVVTEPLLNLAFSRKRTVHKICSEFLMKTSN